ncbi:phosphate/phosphite/phosphonate ABC transporter substrate-binding protein [Reinekea marinisedimentorum]|uniref:ABC-type phosphate/phosphonate transport system substrate-binding protein n=1 Tax=Reinekea marinisedimentorum TaxID=230495 RepID=A0A4R3IDM4_9GAMM|nr:PhnD/SsuA/transferrin family substrate-binding protein [Reinekea marinisedimentorum]TCS43668.1 ABC-type phosphate/phosphonate transport system substrate-binding protein [Reinekea marinisedimentorum]
MLIRFISLVVLWIFFSSAWAEPFVVARVGNNTKKVVDSLKPVAETVIEQAGLSQFDRVEVKVMPNLDALLAEVKAGKVHWVSESAYAAALIHSESDMKAYLRRHKKGVASYGSVLLSNDQINDWADLLGKSITAEDNGSFSGYFLVYRQLREQGLPINFLSGLRDTKSADHVNIVFSSDEENSWAWLSRGLTDSAIFSSTDVEDEGYLQQPQAAHLKRFWQSPDYPRAVELFSQQLGEENIGKIISALYALAAEGEHPVLKAYEKSYQFDELNADDYQNLKSIYDFVLTDRAE